MSTLTAAAFILQAKFMKMYSKTFTLLRRRVLWKTFLNSGITDDDALLKAVEENYSVFVENLENIDRCSEVISQILVPKETPNFSEDLTPWIAMTVPKCVKKEYSTFAEI